MRQFAGFGTAEETNERFRYLIDHGQTGLSTAFDMPSLMGHDSDHPKSLGEVGREGVAIDSLDDMETLFRGIDLGEVTVSMTINAPAAIMLAFYVVAAEEQRRPRRPARRDDPDGHPQGVHRPEGVVLPDRPGDAPGHRHGRVVLDGDAALAPDLDLRLPHPRGGLDGRAGARVHAEERPDLRRAGGRARPRRRRLRAAAVSFFFNAQIDFFEEIAKYRAARRIWARELSDTFGAQNPQSWLMRFHTQTAGVSLTAQQPLNNIIRTTIEALAGVLGGTQSLHTNSYDEALALPTEEAVRIALRTQQIIAHETGVAEHRPTRSAAATSSSRSPTRWRSAPTPTSPKIDELGGMVEAVKQNYPQREIADASWALQEEIDARRADRRRRQRPPARRRDAAADPAHRPGARAQADRPHPGRARAPRGRRRWSRRSARSRRRPLEPTRTSCRISSTPPASTRQRARSSKPCRQVFGSYRETPVF